MQNEALRHDEGLTFTARGSALVVRICRLWTADFDAYKVDPWRNQHIYIGRIDV